jgi:hypothetical protein
MLQGRLPIPQQCLTDRQGVLQALARTALPAGSGLYQPCGLIFVASNGKGSALWAHHDQLRLTLRQGCQFYSGVDQEPLSTAKTPEIEQFLSC